MSIEAMKLALEALEGINDEDRDKSFLDLKQFVRLDMATEALRTAIQQAEAQQPATGEPVWFHKHWCDGDDIFYRPDDNIPSGSTPLYTAPQSIKATQAEVTDEPVYQICRADSVSISTAWVNVQKQQYEDAALYPEYVRRVLYTHPAPSVPAAVARDAERYRWLRAYYHNSEDIGICKWVDEGWSGQWVLEHDPDTSIDAAMLAASLAQKGD